YPMMIQIDFAAMKRVGDKASHELASIQGEFAAQFARLKESGGGPAQHRLALVGALLGLEAYGAAPREGCRRQLFALRLLSAGEAAEG
ncbi:MAG: hypothetical protein ACPH56_03980, partial [Spongiibacter marinus]|uniref:hypothetical protein n=1 Tax=Spongiibacter marinus TaxID=354246 RepID=UPI003C68282E